MFSTVLVANRGEIAVRIIRTLRALNIRSVAIYSDADANARHVAEADAAYRIGPARAADSYLSVDRVMEAAMRSGADALHPGYGFLSEQPALAEACAQAGLVFVGPPAAAIQAMGDKIRAKRIVADAGVRVVPGQGAPGMTDEEVVTAALEVGLPVLLKPSAGGGGKGMRLVRDAALLPEEIASSRREARNSFGDDTLLVERFIERPRHIEIQILADRYGDVVYLGERECSLQRRHQKIVEEAPSPFLTSEIRAAMGAQAVVCARACAYEGAGTVEFIVSGTRPDDFYFMEMNTRLQVEHPVTEMVYGVDLVEWQLRIAAGEPLTLRQADLVPTGHAVEVRLYAEDPGGGFLPTGGTVLALREPSGPGIRVDSGIRVGTVIGSDYDPMLAKYVAVGPDRRTALKRLDEALGSLVLLGVVTNARFLRALITAPEVSAGDLDTGLVERGLVGFAASDVTDATFVAAALAAFTTPHATDAWGSADGWRLGGNAPTTLNLAVGSAPVRSVTVRHGPLGGRAGWLVAIDHGPETPAMLDFGSDRMLEQRLGRATLVLGASSAEVDVLRSGATTWISAGGNVSAVREVSLAPLRAGEGTLFSEEAVTSPMPGKVVAVYVGVGDDVRAGQSLVVVEAMKMEHALVAAHAGRVEAVEVSAGAQVALGDVLVVVSREKA